MLWLWTSVSVTFSVAHTSELWDTGMVYASMCDKGMLGCSGPACWGSSTRTSPWRPTSTSGDPGTGIFNILKTCRDLGTNARIFATLAREANILELPFSFHHSINHASPDHLLQLSWTSTLDLRLYGYWPIHGPPPPPPPPPKRPDKERGRCF